MSERAERRLAAIFAADVAGYTRLMAGDEAATLATLTAHRVVMDAIVARCGGRIANTAGDSVLAEFASVFHAVECAQAIQAAIAQHNDALEPRRHMQFRIGIHVGDVIVQAGDLFGDGVNLAARLQALAEPGGICISEAARGHLGGKLQLGWADGGMQQLKNLDQPVRVFHSIGDLPSVAPAPPLPDRPSIAVLPFQNMSGDADQDYFADGMVEEITTALSRIRWLFVIARNSSFTYKGRAVDVKQVGRELGVRYVLEGSVRNAGDRVRITGQLIEAATGTHLWADRFDGSVEDVFELQDRVTASVVGAIAPKLEQAEIVRAQRKPTASLDAYDHYLRGMAGIHGWTREANGAAFQSFTRAIELDPGFAAAYGMAARCFLATQIERLAGGSHQGHHRGRPVGPACRRARPGRCACSGCGRDGPVLRDRRSRYRDPADRPGTGAGPQLCLGLAGQRLDQGVVRRAGDGHRARRSGHAAEPQRPAHVHHAGLDRLGTFLRRPL